jgi:hypothetical protein
MTGEEMRPMRKRIMFTISMLATGALLLACGDEADALRPGGNPAGGGAGPAAPGDPAGPAADDPAQCRGREYVGYGATNLHQGRAVAKIGVNRGRVKPFGALETEFERVLGNKPATLATAKATFAAAPARWYGEPAANAVALKTAYDIAFDGCLTYVATNPKLAQAPTAASATAACGDMARKFWSKTPAPQEIAACVDVATTGTTTEPDAARKWAYACAAVLTSAGFLTY